MTAIQKVIKYLATAFAIFLTVSIISSLIFGAGVFFGIKEKVEENKTSVSGSTQAVLDVKDDFKSLKIELKAVSLELNVGDKFSVETDSSYITSEKEGNTLFIKDTRSGFGVSSRPDESVIVTLPKNKKLDTFEINSGAGKVRVESISANDIDIELGAGASSFENIVSKNSLAINVGAGKATFDSIKSKSKTKIEVGAGQLTVKAGELKNADVNLGLGEMSITAGFSGNSDFEVGIGSAKVYICGQPDSYSFDVSKGIGIVTIDGKDMNDGNKYGNGKNEFDIDCGIGEMRIRFVK